MKGICVASCRVDSIDVADDAEYACPTALQSKPSLALLEQCKDGKETSLSMEGDSKRESEDRENENLLVLCRMIWRMGGKNARCAFVRLDQSVTVSARIARQLGASTPNDSDDVLCQLEGQSNWRAWSLGKSCTKLNQRQIIASSVVLRIVDDQGDTIALPKETSAREQVSHAVRGSSMALCPGCIIHRPAGILHNALVVRMVPRALTFFRASLETSVTFEDSDSEDNNEDGGNKQHLNQKSVEKVSSGLPTLNASGAYARLRELLVWPSTHHKSFAQFGALGCPRGILLFGEPGTGKTMAARAVALELASVTSATLLTLPPGAAASQSVGALEEALRDLFFRAGEFVRRKGLERARCLIFIDEIDGLFPKRDQSGSGGDPNSTGQSRAVAQLLTLMDGASAAVAGHDAQEEQNSKLAQSRVTVIAATNRPDALDPALRRPGRFEVEIPFHPPNKQERQEILVDRLAAALGIDQERLLMTSSSYLPEFANSLVGFVGADLELLANHFASRAGTNADDSGAQLVPSLDDLVAARDAIGTASLLRKRGRRKDNAASAASASKSVGGYEAVKFELSKALEWPVLHKEAMARMKLVPPRGILMYGPPGCSKTTLARSVAAASGYSFFALSGADVYSPFVGDAERTVREVFANARLALPAVVFLDEVDAMVGKRGLSGTDTSEGNGVQSRVLSTLLNEMDGIASSAGLLVLAATNRKDLIDEALLRPGRFDRLVHVPLPSFEDRCAILRVHTARMPLGNPTDPTESTDSIVEKVAAATDGRSGAELEGSCREAGMAALRAERDYVVFQDFNL